MDSLGERSSIAAWAGGDYQYSLDPRWCASLWRDLSVSVRASLGGRDYEGKEALVQKQRKNDTYGLDRRCRTARYPSRASCPSSSSAGRRPRPPLRSKTAPRGWRASRCGGCSDMPYYSLRKIERGRVRLWKGVVSSNPENAVLWFSAILGMDLSLESDGGQMMFLMAQYDDPRPDWVEFNVPVYLADR